MQPASRVQRVIFSWMEKLQTCHVMLSLTSGHCSAWIPAHSASFHELWMTSKPANQRALSMSNACSQQRAAAIKPDGSRPAAFITFRIVLHGASVSLVLSRSCCRQSSKTWHARKPRQPAAVPVTNHCPVATTHAWNAVTRAIAPQPAVLSLSSPATAANCRSPCPAMSPSGVWLPFFPHSYVQCCHT